MGVRINGVLNGRRSFLFGFLRMWREKTFSTTIDGGGDVLTFLQGPRIRWCYQEGGLRKPPDRHARRLLLALELGEGGCQHLGD